MKGEKKMQINKTKATAIIVIVLMMTSIAMLALPVQAQEEAHGGNPENGYEGPSTIPAGETPDFTINSLAFLSVSPNPIGLGQTLLVNVWTTFPSGEGKYQIGYTVHITKPSGATEDVNLKSYVADGTSWFTYIPDEVGEWTFQFSFAGEWFPAGYYQNGFYSTAREGDFARAIYNPSVYVTPAESRTISLTVQSEYVMNWQLPLPTDYWTRPIEPNNRDWNVIAGNYPWTQAIIAGKDGQCSWDDEWYGPFVTAPNTPHIVWKRQGSLAGIMGGETGNYATLSNPGGADVIFMGRAYDTRTSFVNNVPTTCAACYDIRTGEIYYAIPTSEGGVTPQYIAYWQGVDTAVPGAGEAASFGYELIALSGSGNNMHLYKINPFTGAVSVDRTLPNIGTTMFYRNGYFLSYLSNSSLNDVLTPAENITTIRSTTGFLVNWSVQGSSTDFNTRIVSNISVTIPNSLRTLYTTGGYGSLGAYDPETGITVIEDRFIYGGYYGSNFWAVNLVTGQMIWNISTPVAKMESGYRPTNAWCRNGRYIAEMERGYWQARSIYDGHVLWETEMNDYPWGEFWMYDEAAYQDILYGVGYTGVWALNETNGAVVFHYVDPAIAFETPYNSFNNTVSEYSVQNIRVADGKLYVANSEHTPTQPATRGWGLICLDALTGEKLWKLSGAAMSPGAAADGYLEASSNYDGYLYVLGKGKSETTVTAPQTEVAKNSKVLIQGTVLDMSPAQPGTACISDETMDTWMDYLHMQMPVDGLFHNITVTGVPVLLVATDSNGNSNTVGTATSDTNGNYKIEWTPTAEGLYTITAIFSGTDSYGSSTATTGLSVGPEPTTNGGNGGTGGETTPVDYTWTIVGAAIAVIIAVALVGVVLFMKK
jgi:hypothetical protein